MSTTYPIVCHAEADPARRHRFTVARVTSDLRCTACGSTDLDLDEAAMTTTATKDLPADSSKPDNRCGKAEQHSEHNFEFDGEEFYCDGKGHYSNQPGWETQRSSSKTVDGQHRTWGSAYEASRRTANLGTPEKCAFCDKRPTTWSQFIDSTGKQVLSTNYYCADHEGSAYNFGGDVESGSMSHPPTTSAYKTADFNDPEMAEVHDTTSVSQRVTCSTCLTEHVVTAVDPAQPMPSCPSCGRDTLSPAGSTLATRKTAGWAIVSPSGINLWGMVYDTEEGARAHLDEVKGMGSTSLAPSDVASYEVKQVDAEPNRTYDPSLGGNKFQPLGSTRKTADAYQEAVRRGMMMGTSEFINPGAMLPSSVYVVMEPGPNGARPTDRKTTDRAEANRWAEELLARTDWSPYTSSLDAEHTPARRSAAASGQTCDYDSGSMYGNTHRCGQPATHVVTHSGGSGPMMKTPVCDRHKGSMAGRYPFDSTKVEKIARTLDTAFASLADDIKRQFDKENPSTTDGCDICGDSGHTTAQHEADPRRYDDATRTSRRTTASDGVEDESVCRNCGGEIRRKGPDGTWVHTGSTSCAKAAPGERAPAFAHRRVAAKINQIADGVLATNPGMNRQAALDLAAKTLRTYPAMLANEGN